MRSNFTLNRFFTFLLFLFLSIEGFAQTYTITGNVNASSYSCSTFVGYTTISIGNGSTTTKLTMNQDLDLIGSCSLGPLRIIVNNATIDFSTANNRLTLPEGSSIEFTNGGALFPNGGNGGGCTGSDRIYIGTRNIAACQGSSGVVGFDDINDLGGTGTAYSNSPVCVGNPINLTATPPPNGAFAYSWTGPNSFTSSSQTPTLIATSSSGGVYNVTMTRTDGKVAYGHITVTVNTLPIVSAIGGGSSSVCVNGTTPTFTNSTSGGTWSITNGTGSATITSGGVVTGITAGNVSVVYTVTNGTCSSSVTKSLTVNALPILTVVDPSAVCSPSTVDITSAAVQTANTGTTTKYYTTLALANAAGASNVLNPSAITTSGTYYIRSESASGCFIVKSIVVTVNTTSVAPTSITGTTTICNGDFTTLTLSGGTAGTGATAKWYSGSCGGTLVGSGNSVLITPTTNTTYYVRYEGTCNTTTCASVVVTVNTLSVAPTSITGTTAICNGDSTTLTLSGGTAGTGATAKWYSGSCGETLVGSGNSVLVTPTTNTTYYVRYEGTCNTTICASKIVTVNPLPSTPTVENIIQPTCAVPTGSFTISNFNSSYTYSVTPTTGVNIASGGIVTAPVGSYVVTATATSGSCTASSSPVVITPLEVTTYNGTTWDNGTGLDKIGTITAPSVTPITISVYTELCSCMVSASTNVVVNSGITLKLQDKLAVNGTLTFENNASLVQINDDAINTGNIIYKRKTPPVNRYDFTYWSSPVANQTLKLLSPNTLFNKYYSYEPDLGWKVVSNGELPMAKGEGYIIRAPQNYDISGNPLSFEANFIGIPYNGKVDKAVVKDKVYLLGNPYPSAIDADAFLNLNSAVLEGTLYFWTHNSPLSSTAPGDYLYNYLSADYATYNRTGGVSTAATTGGAAPTGEIAAGQGFFAPAKENGTVKFNNSIRLGAGGVLLDNSQFFKLSTSSKTTSNVVTMEKNRIWLNLTNSGGAFKQTLIGYITGATNDYEGSFDGMSYDGNQFVDFYSVNNAVNLAIQGRALPFMEKDTVTLGYKSTIKGEFQISIDHADGALATQNVFLEDKDLQVLHDLKKEAYTFSTEKGVFNNRFVLRYVDKNTIEPVIEEPVVVESQLDEMVLVSVDKNVINVSSKEDLISKIIVYDMSGKVLFQKEGVEANDFMIQYLLSSQQVLLVNVILANGNASATKIIY